MDEYIERKRVLADISRFLVADVIDPKYKDAWESAIIKAMSIVEEAPTADVRPIRHGHWSDKMVAVPQKNKVGYHEDDYEFRFQCSECGKVLNKTAYCGSCSAKMDGKTNDWISISEHMPPESQIVDTKIDDEKGIRNETQLVFSNGLWWFPDKSMYVYYSPTHWKYGALMDGKKDQQEELK